MTSDPSPEIERRKRREARLLGWGFVSVLALLAADIIARNVGPWQPFWQFYVTWEAASILFTLIVTPIYWHKYISRDDNTAYSDVLLAADNRKFYLALMIIGSAISLIVAGLLAFCIALSQYREEFSLELMLVIEAGCLASGVFFLVVAELMIMTAAPKARKNAEDQLAEHKALLDEATTENVKAIAQKHVDKWEKRAADYKDISDDIGKVLAFSDAPIAIAFVVIFFLVCANALGLAGDGSGLIPPFIAGAVAVQLLYSNFVFYLEASGAFPKWARKLMPQLELLTPMIQGYPASVDSCQGSIANSAVEPKAVAGADDHKYSTSVQVEKE